MRHNGKVMTARRFEGGPAMAARLTEKNGGRVLEVAVSGKLTHSDYDRFVPAFERLVKQHGKIRVLFDMTDFHGWEAAALGDDIKFDLKHFSADPHWPTQKDSMRVL